MTTLNHIKSLVPSKLDKGCLTMGQPGGVKTVKVRLPVYGLLKLYRSLVRSKLDYGCFIYGSARTSYLRCLDCIHHLGLRLALCPLRPSHVESLCGC